MTLPAGVGTGVGSLPGTDPAEAAAIVAGELGLPHLPELPDRGLGADPIGRTAALLVDVPVDHVHRAYRLATSPTTVGRRARDFLRWDLDALEEHWERHDLRGRVPAIKVQACGPFTFAANAELRGGHKIIRDRGAVRDIADSLAAGLIEHVADIERRLGAPAVVQLDETAIGAVLDGTVTPLTRLDPIAPIAAPDLAQTLESIAGQIGRPMILRAERRWDLLSRLDSYAVAVDLTTVTTADYDPLGQHLDAGRALIAGVVPTADPGVDPDRLADDLSGRLAGLIDRIGLPRSVQAGLLLVAPVDGLAGAAPRWARTALAVASRVAGAF
ncbi:MAG: vitamin-B12 independent methionine synthase [Gordonia sp. (in: high G+C Gram-positive bacteria)]|uniref:vitamin-B12 independent methionine synthase n=1 Tax=Gordonia sp. (in: high G+C Gram-positive bacteria) TaxID=84139 RepID=UPI0039E3E808